MSISMAMILLGALMIYAGGKDLSMAALLRGDNTQPKPAVTAPGLAS